MLLKSVDYGDADRVVTFLTGELGKIAVYARGARSTRRRFGAALEPFALLSVELDPGRGETGRLRSAEVKKAYGGILSDLRRLTLAGRALELVRALTLPREPDARLLAASLEMLEAFDAAPARTDLLLRFAMRYCAVAGVAPRLDACGVCGKPVPEGRAALFDPRMGSVVCRACGGGPTHLSSRLRLRLIAAQGASWADPAEPWEPRDERDAERFLGEFLVAHVGKGFELPAWLDALPDRPQNGA